jgi:hypothetical protein
MTYKEMLKEAWETVKEVTSTPLSPQKLTWKEVFRLLRRSLVLGLWRGLVGFVVFFVMLFAVLAVLKLWAEIVHLLR